MVGAIKLLFFVIFIQYSRGVEEWVVKPEGSKVSIVIKDFFFMLEYHVLRGEFSDLGVFSGSEVLVAQ